MTDALKKLIQYHLVKNPRLKLPDIQRQLSYVDAEIVREIFFELNPVAAAAAALGSHSSPAKKKASAKNGKLGGRPRKIKN